MNAADWIEQHLRTTDGDPFRVEPFQRRVVDALAAGEPMRMLTPDEVAARERRNAKVIAARPRETR